MTPRKPDPVRQLEKACLSVLKEAFVKFQVMDWADLFSDQGAGANRIVFGFQTGTVQTLDWNPLTGENDREETSTFELLIEVQDLRGHGKAVSAIRWCVYEVLDGLQPFHEIEPLEVTNYGNPAFNDETGFWSYQAEFITRLNPKNRDLTPTGGIKEITRPFDISIMNADAIAPDNLLIELNTPTEANQ